MSFVTVCDCSCECLRLGEQVASWARVGANRKMKKRGGRLVTAIFRTYPSKGYYRRVGRSQYHLEPQIARHVQAEMDL